MRKILSCDFNLDTACVELRMEDGTLVSIASTAPLWRTRGKQYVPTVRV